MIIVNIFLYKVTIFFVDDHDQTAMCVEAHAQPLKYVKDLSVYGKENHSNNNKVLANDVQLYDMLK